MKTLLLKSILFMVFVVLLICTNIVVFRSEFPYFAFITIIGSVIIFIYFPYNKFFKTK